MNNCYWTSTSAMIREGRCCPDDDPVNAQSYADEERDRSLPGMLESSWFIHHPFTNHQLEDEELPDEMNLTTSTVSDQECQQRDNDSEEYWLMKTEQTEAEMSSLQQPEVFLAAEQKPSSARMLASDGNNGRPLATGRKFLSRSHNSLLISSSSFRQPDYSKVESKVKQYIEAMKASQLQQKKKRASNRTPSRDGNSAVERPSCEDVGILSAPMSMESQKRWAEQEARIGVLQEDHDRLLLINARLQNQLDEMRSKLRQQQQNPSCSPTSRRTNSPPTVEPDARGSSSSSSLSSSYLPLTAGETKSPHQADLQESRNEDETIKLADQHLFLETLREAVISASAIRDQSSSLIRKMGLAGTSWNTTR